MRLGARRKYEEDCWTLPGEKRSASNEAGNAILPYRETQNLRDTPFNLEDRLVLRPYRQQKKRCRLL